ncbi:MAG: GAF domain-containing protein, partial [Candidatus Rokubacteria bacterium]|nr:GAF domain-containing protein [Candidatus Rokubacteria bacterium]
RFLGAVSRSGISDFLLRQTRERLLGIEGIVETGMDLGAAPALEAILRKIVELAARLTGARYGALAVLGEEGEIDRFVTRGIDEATGESIGRPPESMALLGELLREGKTLRLKDLARHPKFSGFPPHHPVMRSLLGVPIRYRDRVIGDLYLADKQGADEFSEEDETLALAFSTQAALAIENARLYAETRERLRHTETLLAVSQAVGSTLDLTEVLRRTVREIVRALGADVGGAYLLTPSRDGVTALAGYRVPKDLFEGLSSPPLLLDHPLIKELRESKRPICSGDSRADPRFDYPLLRLLPHKSVLMSPMWLKDEIIGGFAIGWFREAHTFTAEELRLVEGITRQVAVAIENARLLEAERQARTQLAISETRYRELFEDVIDIVYVHDLDGKILAINKAGVRASGYTEEELLRMNIAQLMAPEELARNKELMRRMVAGERVSEFFTAEFIRKDGTRGFRECSGRLVVKDGVPVALQGVARDVTVRRKLEQRHAAFDEIVKELAAEEDLEQIFSLIGERICQLLGTDSAAFVLVEGEELVLRGSYGLDGPLPGGERRKISESRVGRVVLTRKPHAASDMSVDPHWRDSAVVTQLGYRAILEVPIILQGEVVGVLGALHRSPRAFSSEDMVLLASLAGHTAIALDRTNLVRELKSRLRETQTLLTVSQAVGSTFDLTETMRRVAQQTARALGADMAGAYLADPDGSVLRPLAGYHVPKPLLDGFVKFPIRLKGHRFLEAAWESKTPVYSSDAPADPRIHRETFERFPHRSVLFFPMIVKGEPIGGLFVIWWEEKHHFAPEELRLVEGISRQAALAVENARLFASQQEEAEISGALLKLAEAVGGLQDLDSVLQTVVRVTPQLLGLTRCGLFLLDPAKGVLIPTAAWGLSETLRPAFLALKGAPQIPAVAEAVKSQEPVAVEDASLETWIPRTVATALDIRSMLIIPLLSGGRLMGTMAVDTPGAAHAFTAKQIAIARGIAAHAAVA